MAHLRGLFYFLLLTYKAGVHAYILRSMDDGIQASHTPGWREADKLATSALSHAMNAAILATARDSAVDEQFGALISDHRTYGSFETLS
jgi:hypothetical protein